MSTYITAACVLVLCVRLWHVRKGVEERGCAAAAFKEGCISDIAECGV